MISFFFFRIRTRTDGRPKKCRRQDDVFCAVTCCRCPAVPVRDPCSKAREYYFRTEVQSCIWFKEEPSQFSMSQTAHSLTCSIMEKPHIGLDECLRILLSCFRARNPGPSPPYLELGQIQLPPSSCSSWTSWRFAPFLSNILPNDLD